MYTCVCLPRNDINALRAWLKNKKILKCKTLGGPWALSHNCGTTLSILAHRGLMTEVARPLYPRRRLDLGMSQPTGLLEYTRGLASGGELSLVHIAVMASRSFSLLRWQTGGCKAQCTQHQAQHRLEKSGGFFLKRPSSRARNRYCRVRCYCPARIRGPVTWLADQIAAVHATHIQHSR